MKEEGSLNAILKVWMMFHKGTHCLSVWQEECPSMFIVDDGVSAGNTGAQIPRNSSGEQAAAGVRKAKREAKKGNSVHL